ncbi:hypothetical protein [Lactiplantibacillus mudanjiangensis]|uniref:Uncharacterized protein n=1 Tax=Lactiplantibacillus mudanjiangensis TaxID=1296538 RepID=A0A660E3W3_9LACO|nr:hypothetical protein [Lactiplantibacillus mudanjiangensis]VDG24123.1 hypothetical protein [Lactobacillus pentosus] [Lactiplantibacillus mudanjiangensis]VDG30300.1 hypothetical protein [Lactobacillus pentosus] [Lactiplantibacillus mudanjiangensis]VDG33580.1 hypothetical protein [Lactobacillus pentosus] [Lactiplantibacillus mudanjiangensis]
MKLGKTVLMLVATLGISSAMTQVAQAKTGYHRTKTTAIKSKLFYAKGTKGATYQRNGSLTNFKFKKSQLLKNHQHTTWAASSKTYIKIHGKNRLYYYVHNADLHAQGWVWSGYLKAGRDGQIDFRELKGTPKKFVMAQPGKVYQLGENPFNIHFSHGKLLNAKMTYLRTKTGIIYLQNKPYRYYYVISADKKVKGWVWHKYLKAGQFTEHNVNPSAKPVQIEASQVVSGGSQTKPTETMKPTKPTETDEIEEPEEVYSEWAKDDGKRERLVVKSNDMQRYIFRGGHYQLGLYWLEQSFMSTDGTEKLRQFNDLSYRIDESSPYKRKYYYYGIENKKEYKIDYLNSEKMVLINGDILYDESLDNMVSINPPKKHLKYRGEELKFSDVEGDYPVWFQYNVKRNDFTLWRYNRITQDWDNSGQHTNHIDHHYFDRD